MPPLLIATFVWVFTIYLDRSRLLYYLGFSVLVCTYVFLKVFQLTAIPMRLAGAGTYCVVVSLFTAALIRLDELWDERPRPASRPL